MSDLGERIAAQARTYLGVSFHHAGRSRHGVDCIGLLAVVAHDLGLTDFDDLNYVPEPDPEYLTAVLRRFCLMVPKDEPHRTGDFLQFEILGSARHCGIYAEDERGQGTVIHCYQSAGQVVEHGLDIHWRRRVWAAYRWREES